MDSFENDEDWQPPTEAELKVVQARRERQDKVSKLMGDYLLKGHKMLGDCCPECGTILLRDKQEQDYCVACTELDSDNVKDDPALSTVAARRQAAEQGQRSMLVDDPDMFAEAEPLPTPLNPGEARAQGKTPALTSAARGVGRPSGPDPDVTLNAPSQGASASTTRTSTIRSHMSSSPGSAGVRGKVNQGLATQTPRSVDFLCHSGCVGEEEEIRDHAASVIRLKMQWATEELEATASLPRCSDLVHFIAACAGTLRTLEAAD